jgi:hypothetical protein
MKTDAQRHSLQDMVSCDRIGWDAIQHKDGWWVGTHKGVTCYGDHELARVALTIIWQREGGKQLNYRIKPFTGANVQNGEHTQKLSAVEALKRYEAKTANSDYPEHNSGDQPQNQKA